MNNCFMARKKKPNNFGSTNDLSGPLGYRAMVFMKAVGWLRGAEIWEGGQSR
jgi:hypothetical protein